MRSYITRLALAVLCIVLLCSLVACKDEPAGSLIGQDTTTPAETTPAETTPAETTPAETTVHVHSYSSTIKEPTCSATGYTLNVCECGDQQVTNPTDQLPHTYGEWKTITASTCTTEGQQSRTCTVCGATETQKLAVAGHSYVSKVTDPTKTTQGYTVHTCSVCSDSYTDSYTNATGSVGLAYSQNADGTLTITGIGLCTDTDVIVYSTTADGKSVTAIAEGAFAGNNTIKTLYLPASIKTIGEGAFASCTALTSITVEAENKNFAAVGGVLYTKDMTGIVAFPAGIALTEYTVSKSITSIRPSAFAGCFNLTQFKLADATSKLFQVSNGVLYKLDAYGNPATLIAYPAGKTDSAFVSGLSTATIGDYAFYGASKLRSISIDGVSTIGDYAFANCVGLTSLVIPNTTRELGEFAFAGCTKLSSISFGKSLDYISRSCFSNCVSLTYLEIPDTITKIEAYAFSNCMGLNSLRISDEVEAIGERAFMGCGSLSAVLFDGDANAWFAIDIHSSNSTILTITATLYFYTNSATNPSTGSIHYWHFDQNGLPSIAW